MKRAQDEAASADARTETAPQVFVPPEWLERVLRMEEKFCREIRNVEPRDTISLLAGSYDEGHNLIEPYLRKRRQPKILEIGSGYGFGLCYLRRRGLDAVGIEPGSSAGYEGRYERAIELLEANGIAEARAVLRPAVGEALPFEDETFDIVFSNAVLEHVRDIEKCLDEALRVVKPGGTVVMAVPNYNAFYEGHYDILWLPHLLKSKRVARWYVKALFGRRGWFVDELNFTTPGYFEKLAKRKPRLKKMRLYLDINRRLPVLSRLLRRVGETHYFFRDEFAADRMRLKHRALMRASGLALGVAEFFGAAPTFRLVWEAPDTQANAN